ncbi:CHAT domain-containing protein [Actinoplanes utahensis]|uniref:CHAT domain-containing protein n=1 Tax=Actinoplanes utahensis TaxID=1869 RepID=A0A0A6UGM9_ACTUT|nr:CHAT domain-containing protein [Actinoplanes utahensis]KHD74233.1 hypothetical protein MB27_29830 [Actinoplanes utahensis]GIF35456.1 hypothetical protein Aut01nite_84420 [Actinoplanes utahensis]
MKPSDIAALVTSIAAAVDGRGDLDAAVAGLHRLPAGVPGRGGLAAGLLAAIIRTGRKPGLERLREVGYLLAVADEDPPDDPLWQRHRVTARLMSLLHASEQGELGDARAALDELPALERAGADFPDLRPLFTAAKAELNFALAMQEGDTDAMALLFAGTTFFDWAPPPPPPPALLETRPVESLDDRERRLRRLDATLRSPRLPAVNRVMTRLALGRILLDRVTGTLPGGPGETAADRGSDDPDLARAIYSFREVLAEPVIGSWVTASARVLLSTAETLRDGVPDASDPADRNPVLGGIHGSPGGGPRPWWGGRPTPGATPFEEPWVSEPSSTRSVPPADEPEDGRFLVGSLPAQAPLGAEVSLTVRVTQHVRALEGARFTALRPMTIGRAGTTVTLTVEPDTGMTVLGPGQYRLHVPAEGDSDPVRIEFRCDRIALHRVRVTAWSGGTFLGELDFEVSVSAGGPATGPYMKAAPIGRVTPEDGEVTLQVRRDGGRYLFQLLSAEQMFDPVIVESMAAGPETAVDQAIATLQVLARGSGGYEPRHTRILLQNTGVALWNSMVPEAIREQFWQLRPRITTFTIATGLDVIPWELLYPMSRTEDEGFLVEQFAVTRRVYNQARAREIGLRPARFVAPADGPRNAAAEVGAVHRILSGTGSPDVVGDLAGLLALLDRGDPGLMHFACHNSYRPDAGSSIAMAGGAFVPTLLERPKARKALARTRPLVFVNACRSAGAVPHYTRMMGWAEQFLGAGAGAFVGTLWDVRSSAAQTFAETFYDAFAGGATLGDATLYARTATAAAEGDPTWLSYTVYGDPHATAAVAVDDDGEHPR